MFYVPILVSEILILKRLVLKKCINFQDIVHFRSKNKSIFGPNESIFGPKMKAFSDQNERIFSPK